MAIFRLYTRVTRWHLTQTQKKRTYGYKATLLGTWNAEIVFLDAAFSVCVFYFLD